MAQVGDLHFIFQPNQEEEKKESKKKKKKKIVTKIDIQQVGL